MLYGPLREYGWLMMTLGGKRYELGWWPLVQFTCDFSTVFRNLVTYNVLDIDEVLGYTLQLLSISSESSEPA